MSQFNLRTCSGCGKTFLAKRANARFCNDKSSCRVKASRANKKAQIEADRMTLDVETYRIYEDVTKEYPVLERALSNLLEDKGKETLSRFLVNVMSQGFVLASMERKNV